MKKRLIALSLVLAMAATATACGGSKSDSAAADTSVASDSADASADSADASTEGGVTGDYRELSLVLFRRTPRLVVHWQLWLITSTRIPTEL